MLQKLKWAWECPPFGKVAPNRPFAFFLKQAHGHSVISARKKTLGVKAIHTFIRQFYSGTKLLWIFSWV